MPILRSARFYWDMLVVRTRTAASGAWPHIELVHKDMSGKTILITGANSGIGLELATKLASMNAKIFLACRDQHKADAARQQILSLHPAAQLHTLLLDQASLKSVRQFAASWDAGNIDVLIHNAGLGSVGKEQEFTEDGIESMYQINFLSSFLLTHLLESKLSSQARVIFTTSAGAYAGIISDDFSLRKVERKAEPGFHTSNDSAPISQRYFTTKLMQIAFCRALQDHFDRDGATSRLALSFEPGVVATNFMSKINHFSMKEDAPYVVTEWLARYTGCSVEQGAATGVWLSVSDDPVVTDDSRGGYCSANVVRLTPASFYSQEKIDKLWMRWSADAEIEWT